MGEGLGGKGAVEADLAQSWRSAGESQVGAPCGVSPWSEFMACLGLHKHTLATSALEPEDESQKPEN